MTSVSSRTIYVTSMDYFVTPRLFSKCAETDFVTPRGLRETGEALLDERPELNLTVDH